MGTSSCEVLTWDSEFFGFPIARLVGRRLTPDRIRDEFSWSRCKGIRCLYFLADVDDPPTTALAEANGFQLVDIRMTLERNLAGDVSSLGVPGTVRLAQPGDVAALRALASTIHRVTRYYADPRFHRERCDELYALWIENSCRGWADAVFVAEHEGRPAGYITCHRDGHIGLFGVAQDAQGRKFGSRLVYEALVWFRAHDLALASVVTQGRNVRAQRVYQRAGFVTRSLQLSYHYWFDP